MITRNPWPFFLWKLGGIYLGLVLLALISGWFWQVMLIGTLLLGGTGIYQLWRLETWLRSHRLNPPPFQSIWDDISSLIYHWRQRDRGRIRRLSFLLRRFEESAMALPDGIVALDAHGQMIWWNDSAISLLGLSRPVDRGLRVDNLIRHPRFAQYFNEEIQAPFVTIPAPGNESIVIEVKLVRYGDQQMLLIARDTSEASKLNQMRKDFVANVSHELRTPLTVMHGTAELLTDALDELPEHWHPSIAMIAEQTSRMRQLVDDLLTLSRLETAARIDRNERVDVPQILAQIELTAIAVSGERQHCFVIEAEKGLLLRGSEKELTSAFTNLVYNAINYTPAGKQITIRWYRTAAGACFEVEDQGIGIEKHHLSRITERFYRVDSGRSRETGGTGLGLAIVKRVLLRHQAQLDIESELGVGSRFRCQFTRDWVETHLPEARRTRGSDGQAVNQ